MIAVWIWQWRAYSEPQSSLSRCWLELQRVIGVFLLVALLLGMAWVLEKFRGRTK